MYLGYVLAKLLHPGEGDLGVSVIIRGFIIIVKPDYNRHIPNSSSQFQVLFYFLSGHLLGFILVEKVSTKTPKMMKLF